MISKDRTEPKQGAGQAEELVLVFEDDFDHPELDQEKWLACYLPHWSTPEATVPRYRISDSCLRLMIEDDQMPWCPEYDGEVRVSNLQTGHFSGPLGSSVGQHIDRDGLIVRSYTPERRLFLPHHCRMEMRARAQLNAWNLAALWLIGFADHPDSSGEITFFEAFGHNVDETSARIGRGIKPISDPLLQFELDESALDICVAEWNLYRMDWTKAGVKFYVNDRLVTQTDQSPDYPMQLMLNFYDLPSDEPRGASRDAWFDVDYIRAWEWRA